MSLVSRFFLSGRLICFFAGFALEVHGEPRLIIKLTVLVQKSFLPFLVHLACALPLYAVHFTLINDLFSLFQFFILFSISSSQYML